MSKSRNILVCTVGAVALLAGCSKAPPTGVAATVNGRPITNEDLDRRYKLEYPQEPAGISQEQVEAQKLQTLRNLIDSHIMLQRAEKLGFTAQESDVDLRLNELKKGLTQEEFARQLKERKTTVEEARTQLKNDMMIQKMFDKEISAHVSISDKDIQAFYEANKANYNLNEDHFHLAQIMVTASAEPVNNASNDNATSDEAAQAKIKAIAERLSRGEDFAAVARAASEDPASAPNGGDVGMVPASALEQANPNLRKLVASMPAGQVSGILNTGDGYRILKVVEKLSAGQRQLTDPAVQQDIRTGLINRQDQLMRAAYYEIARSEAEVVNHYAQSIYEKYAGSAK